MGLFGYRIISETPSVCATRVTVLRRCVTTKAVTLSTCPVFTITRVQPQARVSSQTDSTLTTAPKHSTLHWVHLGYLMVKNLKCLQHMNPKFISVEKKTIFIHMFVKSMFETLHSKEVWFLWHAALLKKSLRFHDKNRHQIVYKKKTMQYKIKLLRTLLEKAILNILSKFQIDRWRFVRVMFPAS